MPADAPFFSVEGLAKHFGGVHAVQGLSFTLSRGEIVGLIGPNGSGKTTTINMVTGALKPDEGAILVEGADMARSPAHLYARRGVARTFQVPRLFRRMTVLENVMVPALSEATRDRVRRSADLPRQDRGHRAPRHCACAGRARPV